MDQKTNENSSTKKIRLTVVLIVCTLNSVRSEVFTALTDLEEVIKTESHLINILDNYIKAEEEKLNLLKRYAAFYRSQQDKASENVELYVANPINAYSLVNRLTTNWTEVENLIRKNFISDCVANMTRIKTKMKFPTNEDLTGAAVALARLQDTYRLNTSSLARGQINGKNYSSELSASDCFELGRQFFHKKDYYHAHLWMKETEYKFYDEGLEGVNESDILEHLAYSVYKEGNTRLALQLTNKILEIFPTHTRALYNKEGYEKKLQNLEESNSAEDNESFFLPDRWKYYESLCRGEVLRHVRSSQLKCRYLTKDNPFLLIAPFKVEEAHHNPDVLIFYDVVSDNEIATIKRMAQPRFDRAGAGGVDREDEEVLPYRICKTGWIEYEEHKHLADLSRRVNDMTGLTMKSAEAYQVAQYGIGGQYDPHYDFSRKNDHDDSLIWSKFGNRIATVLFYLSDVEQGGATVFPNIQLALWPQKGAAAFWYNLHPSGDGDKRTLHAACPVLVGSKWVGNVWIGERGQELLKPCTLERPSEELVA